jgi:hypothetical protein
LRAADEGHLVIDVVSLPIVFDVPALVRECAPDFRGGTMELPDTAAQSFGRYRNRLKLARHQDGARRLTPGQDRILDRTAADRWPRG